MLILARALTAQPLASRIGPRLRFRSFSHARNTDSREIARMMQIITTGICHQVNLRIPVRTEASVAPMAPIARPIAAKMPANFAISKGGAVSYTHLRAHETRHDLVCR